MKRTPRNTPGEATTNPNIPFKGLDQANARHRGRTTRIKLLLDHTPQIYQRFLLFIQGGAYAYQAAKTIGVDPTTFQRWMRKGEEKPKSHYGIFYRDVSQAMALARCSAEIEVKKTSPLQWLRLGPGRTGTALEPGWTDAPGGVIDPAQQALVDIEDSQQQLRTNHDEAISMLKIMEEYNVKQLLEGHQASTEERKAEQALFLEGKVIHKEEMNEQAQTKSVEGPDRTDRPRKRDSQRRAATRRKKDGDPA